MSDCASSQPNQAKGYRCNGFAISECFRPFAERRVTRNLYMTGLGLDVTFTHIPELWPLVLDVVLFYCFLCLFDNHGSCMASWTNFYALQTDTTHH